MIFFDQPAHRLDAQAERDHVQQQPVVAAAIAGQHVGLDGGPQRHHLVRIEIVQRCLPEELPHRLLHLRHARGTADHHDALDVFHFQLGIAQGAARRLQGARHQVLRHLVERFARERQVDQFAAAQYRGDLRLRRFGELFLGGARLGQQQARIVRTQGRKPGLLQHPAIDAMVEIVAAQRRVAVGGEHFEHALGQFQDGNIECAAAQVIHRIDAFGGVIQPVGDGGGGRFVQQAQHVEPGQFRRILGGLALCIVKVGGHGDDRADQFAAE